MDERILKWIHDIKLCIDEIDSFFNESEKDFVSYSNNIMLKRAVEFLSKQALSLCKRIE